MDHPEEHGRDAGARDVVPPASEVGRASPEETLVNGLIAECLDLIEQGRPDAVEAVCGRYPELEAKVRRRIGILDKAGLLEDHAPIGPYRLMTELGRGGQAIVYLAEDTRLRRMVALKVLKGVGSPTGVAVHRFQREAAITSRLDHPGICPVFEAGTEQDVSYIAMRYVPGVSLAQRIREARQTAEKDPSVCQIDLSSPIADRETDEDRLQGRTTGTSGRDGVFSILEIIEKAARALQAAHDHGVVHRDIKPQNIMVTPLGQPVILDFGLAGTEDAEFQTLTQTGDVFGTPAYMSPEQLLAQRIRLDGRTDVYSLGVTLFECLSLRRPFDAPTRDGLYQAIQSAEPPDPRTLNRTISGDLAVVVATALEKDRNRRYQTALAFAEDLRRVRSREPILARPAGPLVRLRRWSQRNPALATASVAGLLALAISIVLLIQTAKERDRADRNAGEKEAALVDYERLGDVSRLQQLISDADRLWPADPEHVEAMKTWLKEASALESSLGGHRQVLERLRASGTELSADSYRFAAKKDQFKHDTLAKLIVDLAAFLDPDPKKGLLADVRKRLAFAESVHQETITKYETKWAEAIRSIADRSECPKYAGLQIRPQLGLIPIGKNPASGLWEFAHLQTAAPGADPIPRRDGAGKLIVTESLGLVFVLIPGGTFKMGAISPDEDQTPTEPNVDRDALPHEGPIMEVRLSPFFLSKYEMTQGQWQRVTRINPSMYGPGLHFGGRIDDLRNPVEQVSWEDCDLWLPRLGLILPTEAQWEYAARGGTTTPRWTGLGTDGLAEAANLADAFGHANGGKPGAAHESWNDGYAVHAPVGSFAPNPFGLHDVLGNVSEWCRDEGSNNLTTPDPGDGLQHPPTIRVRSHRGGSYFDVAASARSAHRDISIPKGRGGNLGVRPARPADL